MSHIFKKRTFHSSLQSIHEHPSTYNDDQFTTADTVSTAFTINTHYSTGTDNYLPFSRLSRNSFKLRNTSSFPSILSLYREPIAEEGIVKKDTRSKREGFRTRKREKVDWDQAIDSRNRQEQRAIRIEAIARDQLEKYDKYIKNLKKKVDKQREERQRQYADIMERLKNREEEEKKSKRNLKRPKMDYVHDRRYLKKLPQSKFGKMVLLSDDLSKKGVLKHRTDVDEFWKDFGKHGPESLDVFNRDPLRAVEETNSFGTRKLSDNKDDTKTHTKRGYPLPPIVKKKKKKPKQLEKINIPTVETSSSPLDASDDDGE